jgi:hypothetical protein
LYQGLSGVALEEAKLARAEEFEGVWADAAG